MYSQVDQEIVKNQNKQIDKMFIRLSPANIEYFFNKMEKYEAQTMDLISLNKIRIHLLSWIIKTNQTCSNLYSKTYKYGDQNA